MADITMCSGEECDKDIRNKCYRNRAIASDWQSWSDFSKEYNGNVHCDKNNKYEYFLEIGSRAISKL